MATKKMLTTRVESNPGAGYGFDLPAEIAQEVAPLADPIFQKLPYAQFLSQKSSNFNTIKMYIPDLLDGDPVLLLPQPYPPRKLNPFRYFVVHMFQHWAKSDAQNNILAVCLDGEKMKELRGNRRDRKVIDPTDGKEWTEHIETVLFVLEGEDGVTAARCTFKGTKTEAARIADTTATLIRNQPQIWERMSEAHALSMAAKDPRFMFTVQATAKRGTAKGSGFAYCAYEGRAIPSTAKQRALLASASSDPKFVDIYNENVNLWADRVAQIKSKAVVLK